MRIVCTSCEKVRRLLDGGNCLACDSSAFRTMLEHELVCVGCGCLVDREGSLCSACTNADAYGEQRGQSHGERRTGRG